MVEMSYKVLYRKYRPSNFNRVIGQKSIIDTLKNSVSNNTFSHAYIFTGPRGTGKTSTAKILAKAINCTNLKDGEACGECENCLNFNTTPDVIEIDAASNNGVDEIRELRNNITLAPASSKFKIYIIDEVHMLSTGAFNALLKTLEEPPGHAIFILATTEVYKVPITILSRCQRYDFKKISRVDLINHLKDICKEESIECDEEAYEEIYALSEGCVRDALSILDQMSKTTARITAESILSNYNIISNKNIEELLNATVQNKPELIVSAIDSFEDAGTNAQKIIKKMIKFYEDVAIQIKLGKEKRYKFELLNKLIRNLNSCYVDARINENVFTMIKISFLELINGISLVDNSSPHPNVSTKTPEPKPEPKREQVRETPPVEENKALSLSEIRINNCFVSVNKEALNEVLNIWNNLENKKISTIIVQNYTPVAASDKYTIFTAEEDSLANLFNIKREEIEKSLKKKEITTKVVAITNEEWIQQKEKFKNNRIKKIKYEYIEEPAPKDEGAEMKGQLDTLFTEKVIEIS